MICSDSVCGVGLACFHSNAMAGGHSTCVLLNSCLSSPRHPVTRLPVAAAERSSVESQRRRKLDSNSHGSPSLAELSETRNRQSSSEAHVNTDCPAPGPGYGRPRTAPSSGGGEDAMTEPRKFSTLFTTLLESNALLREEIGQLEGKSCDRTHGTWAVAEETAAAGEGVGREEERREVGVQVSPENVREVLSCSSPARLLQSTNVADSTSESSLEEQVLSSHTPSQLSHQDIGASETKLQGTFSQHKSSSEEEEEEAITVCSDSCAHNSSAFSQSHGTLSPALSLTSISTDDSEAGRSLSTQSSVEDPFASPGAVAIERMWDNFSVEEYAPCRPRERRRVRTPKQVWSREEKPRFTIPEPFSMTVREAQSPKKKSRSMLIAEQERLEKEVQEEIECSKQFRALPLPASTYLSLDQLREKGEEQREQMYKDNVQSIKPFSFMQREEERRQRKLQALRENKSRDQHSGEEEKRIFKAKPIPQHVLSPRMTEQLKEKEEYRRICIRVRSQEMLASAEMPRNMQVRGEGTARVQRREERKDHSFVSQEHTFHPKINPKVPDHDRQYSKFQQQLAAKREFKQTTAPEPFLLRTSLIPSRSEQIKRELEQYSSANTTWTSATCPSRSSLPHSHSLPAKRLHTIQMTEAARLRHSVSQKKLADKAEREIAEESLKRAKREQERELQRKVSQRVQSYDHTAWLEEKKRERLQELRYDICLLNKISTDT